MTRGLQLDGFEHVKDIGQGNFGVAKLMRNRATGEEVAVKFLERGPKIDRNVEREILNHRQLQHGNIVAFKEVRLTPQHLAIVMEYAAGGELFTRVCNAGRFKEDEARYFFQQLISGVHYCHTMSICHRDLKLENTLLTDGRAPRLKICDFGYSKSGLINSQPKSTVGTPAYIAPEVLRPQAAASGSTGVGGPNSGKRRNYDGNMADVWSCGVTLYVMLVGSYPFEDPRQPRNFKETIRRILAVQYEVPPALRISAECQDLLRRIFQADPSKRIAIAAIRDHAWFRKNLPSDLSFGASPPNPRTQPVHEVEAIIREAREPTQVRGGAQPGHPADLMMSDEYGLEGLGSGDHMI